MHLQALPSTGCDIPPSHLQLTEKPSQSSPYQDNISTYTKHMHILRGHQIIKSSNQAITQQNQKNTSQKAQIDSVLCIAVRTTHLPNANKILPSHVSDARPSLSRIATTKIELASPQSPSRASDSPKGRVAIAFQRCINGAYVRPSEHGWEKKGGQMKSSGHRQGSSY